jgi:hypothetical protein
VPWSCVGYVAATGRAGEALTAPELHPEAARHACPARSPSPPVSDVQQGPARAPPRAVQAAGAVCRLLVVD